jgi:hypothetical protein
MYQSYKIISTIVLLMFEFNFWPSCFLPCEMVLKLPCQSISCNSCCVDSVILFIFQLPWDHARYSHVNFCQTYLPAKFDLAGLLIAGVFLVRALLYCRILGHLRWVQQRHSWHARRILLSKVEFIPLILNGCDTELLNSDCYFPTLTGPNTKRIPSRQRPPLVQIPFQGPHLFEILLPAEFHSITLWLILSHLRYVMQPPPPPPIWPVVNKMVLAVPIQLWFL